MKRPSGFDRAPEASGAREAGVPAVGESENRAPRPGAAFRFVDRRRKRKSAGPGAAPDDVPDSVPELSPDPLPAANLGSRVEPEDAPDDDNALTEDLGEVRGEPAGLQRHRPEADPVRAAERRVRDATKQLRRRERRERRRFSLASRARRRNWLIAGGAVTALALFVLVGVLTPVMSVRNIEISGASTVNTADVEQALSRFTGTPLALVDEDEVRQVLEPFPLIERYALERIPPDTLLVRIEERVPVLSLSRDDVYQQVDAAGVVVGSTEAPPVGVPVAEGRVTDLDSAAFASAAVVLRDLSKELRDQVTSVTASSGEDVMLTLASGVEVMWGGSDNTARKGVVLTAMLASLSGTPVSYIDVSSSEAPVFR